MSASGGSTSDQNISTNKVVDGQSHYLAYITPDEGKSLMDQGGKEVITDSGIPAYPTHHGSFGTSAGVSQGTSSGGGEGPPGGGDQGMTYDSRPPQLGGSGTVEQAEQFQDTGGNTETTIDNIKEKINSGIITVKEALNIGKTLNLVRDSSFINMITTAGGAALVFAGGLGEGAQKKAMTWSLENRLKSIQKQKDFHPGAYGYKISDIQSDIEGVKEGTFSQNDFTKKYGSGDASNPLDASFDPSTVRGGDNARGLTNVITPYAAHAIGGTAQQPSQAAQWYANLGSGNSNPGAFNLTQQYAAAKAAVSQKLQSTSSVGQIAVADSAFFNFLKDNSLNKGIL